MPVKSFEISDEDIKKIERISKSEDLNKSQVIRRMVDDYFKKWEKENESQK